MGLTAVVVLPMYFGLSYWQGRQLGTTRHDLRCLRDDKNEGLPNLIDSAVVIKSFVREGYEEQKQNTLQQLRRGCATGLTNIIIWSAESQGSAADGAATFAKPQTLGAKSGPRLHYPFFSPLSMTCETPKNTTGKVLLTALAGAGVGAALGVLLYSKKGVERRQHFRQFRTDQRLRLRGDWDLLKGKLQQAYTQLTDEDLTYVEGKGHELVSRLQAKLGKRKRQIVKMLNAL